MHEQGPLLIQLTEKQKLELYSSYVESFDSKNLLNHEDVQLNHQRWF